MLPWIVFGVLFIALIFTLVKSLTTWTWVPVVALVGICLTTVFGAFALSYTFKARTAWIRKDQQNRELLEKATARFNEAMYGAADAIEYGPESHEGLNSQVSLLEIGQGRIWQEGQAASENGNVRITFSDTGIDGTTGIAAQLNPDMTVFAFANRPVQVGGQARSLPIKFLGSFAITDVDAAGNSVVLKPRSVTADSVDEVNTPTSSWSLFERMPGDSRTAFVDDLGMTTFDIDAYRKALREKYLTPEMVGLDPDSKEYEALLDEYSFDGLPMSKINTWISSQTNRINDNFDPPTVFRDTELLWKNKAKFRVDGSGNPTTDGPFSEAGEANLSELQLGKEVELGKDQHIVVSADAARVGYKLSDDSTQQPLTEQYGAEEIVDYFRRALRDYPFALQRLGEQTTYTREAIEATKKGMTITESIIENTSVQLASGSDMMNKLQQDIARREQELAAISKLHDEVEARLAAERKAIRTYYEQIMEMYGVLKNGEKGKSTAVQPEVDPLALNRR